MLAKARNDHATEFRTSMGMYFFACGTSRSLFDVLDHVGITLSYRQGISKLKRLSEKRLTETRKTAKSKAFMLPWDNLNIAFKVSELRLDSKDYLTMERQPLSFRFTASNKASFFSSQSEQTVDLSSRVWPTRSSPKPRGSSTRSSWPTLAHQIHFI